MPTPNPAHGTPSDSDLHPTAAPRGTGRSAVGGAVVALALSTAAVLSAPLLLLIPYVGFLPALIAGAGIVVAWASLRGSTHGTGLAVTGLIVSVVLSALLAGLATVWTVVVADPAVRDYEELHEVIDHIKSLIFGS